MDRRAGLDDQRFHPTERHDRLDSTTPRPPKTTMSRPSPRAGATRLVLAVVTAAALAGTEPASADASPGGFTSRGPWIDKTLSGGAARDLSIQELRAVNLARGLVPPR